MSVFGGSVGGHWGFGRASAATDTVRRGGALDFDGTFTNNLAVLSTDLGALGTNDFTIQWWQYLLPSTSPENSNPFVFSMGAYIFDNRRETIAFWWDRVGGDELGIWANLIIFGQQVPSVRILRSEVENQWVHVAVVREGLTLRIYTNGVQLASQVRGSVQNIGLPNVSEQSIFTGIGAQFTLGQPTGIWGGTFRGRLALFEWVRGHVRYPDGTSFTPPLPLAVEPVVGSTRLLLRAEDEASALADASGLDTEVTVNGSVPWVEESP